MSRPEAAAAEALLHLHTRTASVAGKSFFRAFAEGLSEVLGLRHVAVGALVADGRVQILSHASDGAPLPSAYDLRGTPCAEVMAEGQSEHPDGVAAAFPHDSRLAALGAVSYWGMRVASRDGTPVGLVAAFHDAPSALSREVLDVARSFAPRAAVEIERERREDDLSRSLTQLELVSGRYRRFMSECMEGVWAIDAEARTTFVNPQMSSMLGYTENELLGRSMYDFMDDRARQEASVNMERRRRGVKERHEFRFRHRTGRDVWVVLSATPLNGDDGAFTGALAFASDVTEWRGLELRVQQAQKLESLGLLAGGVAHDFNNLLVGIIGNVGLAKRETTLESSVRPLLEDIENAAARAAELTRQLLAYSGKGKFVVRRLSVNRLLEEMSPLLSSVLSKKAALRLNLGEGSIHVEADATQLRQVVMNLVTNASDALGDRSGIVSITTGIQVVDRGYFSTTYLDDSLADGTYVFIEVSDTGAGMDRDTVEKIFDPFFTTKFTGRGLGLAAVLGILRSHKGAIKVYSEPTKGSTFKALLPQSSESVPDEVASSPALAPAPGGTVLVADDEGAVREVARRVLERAGYSVVTAVNGRDAVDRFTANGGDFVAVVLDMTMPVLSGEEVFRELRRLRPAVRVILTSGYNEQDATQQFVGKGLAHFLQKPWRPSDLLRALDVARGAGGDTDAASGDPET